MLYHPRLNVLLLCGNGGGVSGWRLLDGFPHWAPVLGQSVEKVGRQGTAAYNIVDCVCLCGLGTAVVQTVGLLHLIRPVIVGLPPPSYTWPGNAVGSLEGI